MTDDLGWQCPTDDGSGAGDRAAEAVPFIGGDERRLQVRAYRFWAGLQAGRVLPLIDDLDRAPRPDFADNAILIDVSGPAADICFIGDHLRAEAGLTRSDLTLSQIPARSLISRLTDRCAQVISGHTALGFEAEFVNQRGIDTLYRGLLLPFSRDGTAVDYVYGVINWKEVVRPTPVGVAAGAAVDTLDGLLRTRGPCILWRDAPVSDWLRRNARG